MTLALIYLEQRRYRESKEAFRHCLRINSENSTACHGLGQLCLLQEHWAEAESQLGRALEFNPGNAYACETLGKLHQALKRVERAEEMYRLAIRMEPDEPAFQTSLADLLRQSGRGGQAGEILARVAAAHPADLRVVRVHSEFLADTGRTEAADAVFQGAPREAWSIYVQTLARAPADAGLRDAILRLRETHPSAADLSLLPPSRLTDVLKTDFWREQPQAESLWASGRRSEAAARFASALEQMDAAERRVVGASAFNMDNEERSIHQIVTRWARRILEADLDGCRRYLSALEQAGFDARTRLYVAEQLDRGGKPLPPSTFFGRRWKARSGSRNPGFSSI